MNIVLHKLKPALAIACSLMASIAVAAESKPFAAPRVAEHVPASTAGSLVQVTVSLLLVLAAVFAAGWVVRKLRGFGKFQSDAITLIADLPLGAKERAVIVQVGNQQLMLGVAPGRVSMLHVLSEHVGNGQRMTGNVQNVPVDHAEGQGTGSQFPARPDFKAILKRSLGL